MHLAIRRFGLLTSAAVTLVAAGTFAQSPLPASAAPPPNLRMSAVRADAQGFSATFEFPEPTQVVHDEQISARQTTQFIRLVMPDSDSDNYDPQFVGTPEIPFYRRIIAAPRGTQRIGIKVSSRGSRGTRENFLLYPIQDQAVDPTEFDDPPFAINEDAYTSDLRVPLDGDLVKVTPLGTVRDLEMFALDMAVAQYNPAARLLEIFSGVTVDLTFLGDQTFDGTFFDSPALNPFESQVSDIYAGAINYSAVASNLRVKDFSRLVCFGSEYLIITPPEFRAAADTLKTWKNQKGISTTVVETGSGTGKAGTTRTQIRDYIRNRFNTCGVRLSYVLLLADSDRINPFYRTADGATVASDLDYSLMNDADILPDLAVGRIPVDTLAQAQTVVDKIVAYEKSPPFDPPFYRNASIASFFQCCRTDIAINNSTKGTDMRWFVETSELVRNEMLARGYTVQRIYTTNTGFAEAAVADATPRRYYDGTPLPAELAPGSGAWNGSTTDVVNAINAGRFLVLHRDHGAPSGWGDPGFSTGNLGSLTNGSRLPVIFSINCASGQFDNELIGGSDSFVEQVLSKSGGGAVGVLGDTRNSPTIQNNTLTRGFFDAIWPNTLPGYGGGSSIRRLGDILNYGKAYMVSEYGVANEKVKLEMAIWTTFGDPTMEMWTRTPYRFGGLLTSVVVKAKFADHWVVSYPQDGTVITALQDGLPIGRATVQGGEATIDFLNLPSGDKPVELSASGLETVATPLFQGSKVYAPIANN